MTLIYDTRHLTPEGKYWYVLFLTYIAISSAIIIFLGWAAPQFKDMLDDGEPAGWIKTKMLRIFDYLEKNVYSLFPYAFIVSFILSVIVSFIK